MESPAANTLDVYAQSVWPRPGLPPRFNSGTVLFHEGMSPGSPDPRDSVRRLASLAAHKGVEFAAIRFESSYGLRAYAWAVDGSDAATFQLDDSQRAVRTGEPPPDFPRVRPSTPRHQDLTLDGFITEIINKSPDICTILLPAHVYLSQNRRHIVWQSSIDFSEGDPPFLAQIRLEGDAAAPIAVLHVEDTENMRAYRLVRRMRKRLLRDPAPNGEWGARTEVPSRLSDLRSTLSKG